jgi:hypothetical protein
MADIFIISFETLANVRPVLTTEDEVKLAEEAEKDSALALIYGSQRRGKRIKKVKWDDDIITKFQHIAIDETQQIKNPSSNRTRALQDVVRVARTEWKQHEGRWAYHTKETPLRVAGYSGTPIKNRPSEYWTLLNMIRPEQFPFFADFCRHEVRYSLETGKEIGLRNPEAFPAEDS